MLAPAGVATVPPTAIGIAAIVTPRWSPDGRWLAFLKRVDETDRVWRVNIATGLSSAITPEGLDISDFRIVNDGRIVVRISTLPPTPNDESRTGYHYDDRFVPMRSSVPIVPKSEAKYLSFDVPTGTQRDADAPDTTMRSEEQTSAHSSLMR